MDAVFWLKYNTSLVLILCLTLNQLMMDAVFLLKYNTSYPNILSYVKSTNDGHYMYFILNINIQFKWKHMCTVIKWNM